MAEQLDTFTRAYLEAALWTEDTDPGQGEWAEHDEWTIENLDPQFLTTAITDCFNFQRDHEALLSQAGDEARNGHDFWLTRNGHGVGFWDRGYDEVIGHGLTAAAHAYGEAWVDLVDDPRFDEDGDEGDQDGDEA